MIANPAELFGAQSLPREPPSERDMQIFAAVRVDCRRQVDVAAEFGICQSRVSQIITHVMQWRMGGGLAAELATRDRRSVECWLDQQRLEWLYEHTLELFRQSCQPKRRERAGTNQHGDWHETTTDHQTGNMQCLRLAARIIELRWKLDERTPAPLPHALMHADFEIIRSRLGSMVHHAQARGELPRDENPYDIVKRKLDELLGKGETVTAETEARGGSEAERRSRGETVRPAVGSSCREEPSGQDAAPGESPGSARQAEPTDTTNNVSADQPDDEGLEEPLADVVSEDADASCDAGEAPSQADWDAAPAEKSRADISVAGALASEPPAAAVAAPKTPDPIPSRLERLLSSGRPLPATQRRHLQRLAAGRAVGSSCREEPGAAS